MNKKELKSVQAGKMDEMRVFADDGLQALKGFSFPSSLLESTLGLPCPACGLANGGVELDLSELENTSGGMILLPLLPFVPSIVEAAGDVVNEVGEVLKGTVQYVADHPESILA